MRIENKVIAALLIGSLALDASDITPLQFDEEHCTKPKMLIVSRPGCPACKAFDKMVSKSRLLRVAMRNYDISLMQLDEAVGKGYGVYSTPTVFLFQCDGKLLAEPVRGTPRDSIAFLEYLQNSAAYFESLHPNTSLYNHPK